MKRLIMRHLAMFILAMTMPAKMAAISGSGTSSSPYIISKDSEWTEFRSKVSSASSTTKIYAKLTADINVSGSSASVGTADKPFYGEFNGNGFTITLKGISSKESNFGLFGYTKNAVIKELTLKGTMTSNGNNTGSVVGNATEATKLQNVYSSVNISMSTTATYNHIGGLVGQASQASGCTVQIKGCSYSGTLMVFNSYDSNGGIVGYCEKEANVEIEYCAFLGKIVSTASSPRIGGILGYADDTNGQNFQYIRYCYCAGKLTPSTGTYVGIFAGYPRGNVPGVITNNTYTTDEKTNMAGNDYHNTLAGDKKYNSKVTISVTSDAGGTVSWEYVNPTTSSRAKVKATATPGDICHFTQWTSSSKSTTAISTQKTYETPLSSNVSLYANYGYHTYGDWVTYKLPGCTTVGLNRRTCTFTGCGAQETGEIPDKGHGHTKGFTSKYEWSGTADSPSCKFFLTCNDCKQEMFLYGKDLSTNTTTDGYINKAGSSEATCETDGYYTYYAHGKYSNPYNANEKFNDSGYSENNKHVYPISKKGHGNGGYKSSYEWTGTYKDPVCKFTLTCSDCNKRVVDAEQITDSPTSHGYISHDAAVNPGKYTEGSQKYYGHGMYTDAVSSKSFTENGTSTNYNHSYTIPKLIDNYKAQAVFKGNTLTFYFDDKTHEGEGKVYTVAESGEAEWFPNSANINYVVFDASFADYRPKTCYDWFCQTFIESITGLEYLNTSQVTDMRYMFSGCSKLKYLDLSNFDTDKVASMQAMFYSCSSLTSIRVSDKFVVKDGVNTQKMFDDCKTLMGGMGTTYDANHTDGTYARIDGKDSQKGYFTYAVLRYMESSTSLADDENDFNVTLTFAAAEKAVTVSEGGKTLGTIAAGDTKFTLSNQSYGSHSYTLSDGTHSMPVYASMEDCRTAKVVYKNEVMTFYYDVKYHNGEGDVYYLPDYLKEKDAKIPWLDGSWWPNIYPVKAVMDKSMANYPATNLSSWFLRMVKLKTIEGLKYLNTANVTDMHEMFRECKALQALDLSTFNTAKVTNMSNMFYGCENLETIYASDEFVVKDGADTKDMFYDCTKLKGGMGTAYDEDHIDGAYARIDGEDSQKGYFTHTVLRNMASSISAADDGNGVIVTFTFDAAEKAVTVSEGGNLLGTIAAGDTQFTLSNQSIAKHSYTFADGTISVLYTITDLRTAKVVYKDQVMTFYYDDKNHTGEGDVYYLPDYKANKDAGLPWINDDYIPTIDPTKAVMDKSMADYPATNLSFWFQQMRKLKTIKGLGYLNTTNVTDMNEMFCGCGSLQTLDLSSFNTAKVTNMYSMFTYCVNLTTIYASDKFVVKNDANTSDMFYNCTQLKGGLGTAYDANYTNGTYARIDDDSQEGYFTKANIFGDLNGDGKVSLADLTLLIEALGKGTSADALPEADVDFNNTLNLYDLNKMVDMIME